jgi:ABC-2 type transport system ATP-binding protein
VPEVAAEFLDVSKVYPRRGLGRSGVRAVDGVSFAIRSGEVFGLVGPNRAGKTTLVKLLLSLCRASSGNIVRLGAPASDPGTLAKVGYMHENQAFPRYLTARRLLEYYGALSFVPPGRLKHKVPELLQRVGLADRADEPIWRFSKGMVQRLALAQALINDPELLVLDEPGEGLDLTGRNLVREVVRQMREAGKTVLLVSHLLGEVERLCDRVAVLVQGRLVRQGHVAELTRSPDTGQWRSLEQALREIYTEP